MDTLNKLRNWLSMRVLNIITRLLKVPAPDMLAGEGSAKQLCRLIAFSGFRNVLIVTDADLVRLNLHKPLLEELERLDVKATVFHGISPNPTEEQMEAGIAAGKQVGCDAVLGLGGGSPMDSAKVVACGITNDKPISAMEGAFKLKEPGLPIYLVPTTAGTGSEVTIASVVTSTREKRKFTVADTKLVASAIALDHTLMLGIPPKITAETGMDVLTHAVEAFISTRADSRTMAASRLAVKLVFDHLKTVYDNGGDLTGREAMAFASYKGGIAIQIGVGYVHGIAHQLGGRYHITHGLANAVLLPHVLDFSKDKCTARLAELADVAGLETEGKGEAEKADLFIGAVKELSRSLDIPETFEQIQRDDFPKIYAEAQKESISLFGIPKYMTRNDMYGVLEKVMA